MSKFLNQVGSLFGIDWKPEAPKVDYTARPCGEIDYDALCDEVIATYPKILGRLAQ